LGYYEQARAINERDSNLDFLSSNYSNIGLVYDGMGEPQKAIEFHERALELRTRLGNEMTMTSSKIYLGFAHTHLGNHSKAIDYLKEGLKVAMDNDAKAAIQHSCLGLYQAFKAQGNYKAALEAHEKYIELEDTLRNDEMAGKVARAEMEFRGAQQKKDLALLRQNDALKAEAIRAHDLGIFTATIVAAIALLLMAMLVAVVFWLRYRSKKKSAGQLERSVAERTEALLRANDELSKFIYQSSHGLRSPLTSIQGLASIAMGEAGKGEERHYIELIMGRVAHLDGVNTGLIEFMHVKERAVQLLPVPLEPLLEKVIATVALRRKNAPLHLHSQLAPDATVVADEFLLGIILQNLLLNVIDFCVVGQDPEATLELVQGNGKWELRLQDKGIGIPAQFLPKAMEMFSRGNPRSQGSGIGLYTARQAAEKMQAQLILHSVEHQGTLATVQCESGV
jgi:signal transduction histidine kinase